MTLVNHIDSPWKQGIQISIDAEEIQYHLDPVHPNCVGIQSRFPPHGSCHNYHHAGKGIL